ncbi:MAG TPA: arylamine N-acetyltransferase [Thermoanaerobaculia bacterium]|jgi:arylamine N-acetyltransferase
MNAARRPAPRLSDDLVDRFLRILGTTSQDPGLAALRELVAAYVTRVPFENVSKIHRWKLRGLAAVPEAPEFLDGIERFGFGGTCYANNYNLYALLASLGYDVTLCGADMQNPDVHMVVLARVEGREFLLDAGYAAPFLEPLPRDLEADHVVALGRDRWVLRPQDREGRSRLELHRDGAVRHFYVVKPAPKALADFHEAVAASFRPDATFLNALLLARFRPGEALFIHNLTVVESRGLESRSRALRNRKELVAEVQARFDIPGRIVSDVLGALGGLTDAWG